MVFTTHLFIFYYLSLFLIIYYILPFRARTALIALASYLFYGWANPLWPLLMFVSSGVDYVCGLVLLKQSKLPWDNGLPPILPKDRPRTGMQTAVLVASIVSNMGLLIFFKYTGFLVENLNALSQLLGQGDNLVTSLQIALPVGISFYTFKSMSYAIDVYKGDARPMVNFVDFCCFEAFFPDLVAGPIVRYGAIERQMRVAEPYGREVRTRGDVLFAGHGQENLDRQPSGAGRRRGIQRGWAALVRRVVWSRQLRLSDLFRLLGLFRHGERPGLDDGLRLDPELRLALSGRKHHRLLAPLAHQPLDVAPRLPVHHAGRQPPGQGPHLHQSHARDVDRRLVARSKLELRHLGRDPRRHARFRADAR